MPYSRQRPRIAAGGRITVRLTTAQRDLFLGSPATPKDLGHALHRAPVKEGRLTVRLPRPALDALIAVAARQRPADRRDERALDTLLRYLEALEDRFHEPEQEEPRPAG